WLWLAVIQGVILAVNFFLLAYTAQKAGVSVAALASRVSVAIPSILAFLIYGDSLAVVKLLGVFAGVLFVDLLTVSKEANSPVLPFAGKVLPILVFLTFGCYFFVIKYAQSKYLDESSFHDYVMSAFLFAFLTSLAICLRKGSHILTEFRSVSLFGG